MTSLENPPRISDDGAYCAPLCWTIDDHCASLTIDRRTAAGLGEVMVVELPEVGEELKKGDLFGAVQTLSQSIFLQMPMDGRIIAINDQLENDPELIKADPHGAGWLIRIDLPL